MGSKVAKSLITNDHPFRVVSFFSPSGRSGFAIQFFAIDPSSNPVASLVVLFFGSLWVDPKCRVSKPDLSIISFENRFTHASDEVGECIWCFAVIDSWAVFRFGTSKKVEHHFRDAVVGFGRLVFHANIPNHVFLSHSGVSRNSVFTFLFQGSRPE